MRLFIVGLMHLETFKSRSKILILLFFVFSCALNAQRIFFDGNYDYSFNADFVDGVSEIDFESKYSIDSDSVYIFSRKLSVLYFNASDVTELYLDSMLIIGDNPDSLTVKFRDDGPEHLLYDFNLKIGSVYTIYPDRWTNPGSDSMTVTILGYGDTLISGQLIPYQTVEYTFDRSPFAIVDNLYKGIGSLRFYFEIFDIFGQQLGGGLGGPLVCYNSPEISYINETLPSEYINDISDECLMTSSLDRSYEEPITVYPNPTNGYLNISSSTEIETERIRMFSSLGMQHYLPLRKESDSEYSVDISHLPSGVFFLLIGKRRFNVVKN